MHAPEVACIAKGKARTPYEFGAKIGITNTNREGLLLAAKSVEATIGHMKTDGRLDRNFLAGHAGNALLAGVGHNLRLTLKALAFLLTWILYAVRRFKKMAKPNTLPSSVRYQISTA